MTSGHVEHVLIPLLKKAQQQLGRRDDMEAIGKAIGALLGIAGTPAGTLPPDEVFYSSFLQLAIDELATFNLDGCSAVASVSEAIWKVQGIMNPWQGDARSTYFFRGEHQYNWPLLASAGRKGILPGSDPALASPGELDALKEFQANVKRDAELKNDVFPRSSILHDEDPDWWALMQHFRSGTRLVDVTSSPLCALWFACSDWDGTINDGVDGALYLFPTHMWRPDSESPDIIRGRNVGPTDPRARTASDYFNLGDRRDTLDVVRFRASRARSDRELAQDGYFLWQPRFNEEMKRNLGQVFKFRVTASRKGRILRELYSLGYTAQRIVRGKRGEQAHSVHVRQLGLPAL